MGVATHSHARRRSNALDRGNTVALLFRQQPKEARCRSFQKSDPLSAAQEAGKCLQGGLRDVVLDSLCIGFGGLQWTPYRAKQIDDEPMPGAHSLGQRLTFLSQEYPAIW